MSYDVVYSLPWNLYTPRALLALPAIPMILLGRYLWQRNAGSDVWDWLSRLAAPAFLVFAGAGMLFMFLLIPTAQGLNLWVRVARGHSSTVEGVVEQFELGNGHVAERWVVVSQGVAHTYVYNPFKMTPGFDRIQRDGGPIHSGLRVRITDVGGHIARLEVENDSPRAPSN